MRTEIDITKKPEKPNIFLAKPDKTIIAKLTEAYSINHSIKLGALNEIEFSIPYYIDRKHEIVKNDHVDQMKERYLLLVQYAWLEEWYIINKPTISADGSSETLKIHAYSLGYELKDKIIRGYDTNELGSKLPRSCTEVLNEILVDTLWSVGTVDVDLDLLKRSYNISSSTALDVVNQVAENIQGVLDWDTDQREVNVLKSDNIGNQDGRFKLSYGRYLKSVSRESNADEMVTRLKPYGKDNLMINEVNASGTNYLEDFSYFLYPYQEDTNGNVISHSDYMSDGLCKAILDYQKKLDNLSTSFSDLLKKKDDLRDQYNDYSIQLAQLDVKLNQISDLKKVQIANGTYQEWSVTTGTSTTKTFILKGGKRYGIFLKVSNTAGNTFSYTATDGSTKPLTCTANTWQLVDKVELNELDSNNLPVDKSIVLSANLGNNTTILAQIWEITANEYHGLLYEGIKIASNTENGATSSFLVPLDGEDSFSNISVGNTLYIENGKEDDWQYSGSNSDYVGTITALNAASSNVTLNNLLTDKQVSLDSLDDIDAITSGQLLGTDTTNKQSGTASVKVTCDGTVPNQGFHTFPTVSVNGQHTFSVYLKADTGTPKVRIGIWNNTDKKDVGVSEVTLSTSWQKYTVSGNAGSVDKELWVYVDTGNIAQKINFWADTMSWSVTATKVNKIILDTKLNDSIYVHGFRICTGYNGDTLIDKYIYDHNQQEYDNVDSSLLGVQGQMDAIDGQINALKGSISIEDNFTPAQILERNQFVIEKEWTNSNIVEAQDLLDEAKKQFELLKTPQTIIEIDLVNIFDIIEAQREWDRIGLGDKIIVKYERMNINIEAKLIAIDIDHESSNLKFTIANVKDIKTKDQKFLNAIYNSISTSTTVDINKFKWSNNTTDIGEVNFIIDKLWDRNKQQLSTAANETVTINGQGITITDPNDNKRFLRATHGVLAITDDGGNTYKNAITADGIVGSTIYGKIIAGVNLTIDTGDGSFRVDANGVNISGTKLTITEGDNGVALDTASGLVITREDNMVRSTFNATDGILIETRSGSNWQTSLSVSVDPLSGKSKLMLSDIVASGEIEATSLSATTQLKVNNIDVTDLIGNGLQQNARWIKAGMIEAGTITADLIKANELIVGTNVTMGANATISWGQVTSKPNNLATTDQITWNTIKSTVVTQGGIDTPMLNANIINADKLDANAITSKHTITGATLQTATSGSRIVISSSGLIFYGSDGTSTMIQMATGNGAAKFKGSIESGSTISGATISGGTINVSTDVNVGANLILNGGNFSGGIQWSGSTAYVYYDPGGNSITLSAPGGVYAKAQRLDQPIVAVFG